MFAPNIAEENSQIIVFNKFVLQIKDMHQFQAHGQQ